jgi:hypothetical protein
MASKVSTFPFWALFGTVGLYHTTRHALPTAREQLTVAAHLASFSEGLLLRRVQTVVFE